MSSAPVSSVHTVQCSPSSSSSQPVIQGHDCFTLHLTFLNLEQFGTFTPIASKITGHVLYKSLCRFNFINLFFKIRMQKCRVFAKLY